MAYSILNVANRILELAKAEGKQLDPLKLQKLTYLAHGWKLAFTSNPLVTEGFDAWKYGPVNPHLYQTYKQFKANPIIEWKPQEPLSPEDEGLLKEILRVYGSATGVALSTLTHEPGSAWRATYDSSYFFSPAIPTELIKAEFDQRRASGRG